MGIQKHRKSGKNGKSPKIRMAILLEQQKKEKEEKEKDKSSDY